MQKYPNGDKVTTNISNFGKASETKSLCDGGLSQIYQASDLIIHGSYYSGHVFHLCASSSLDYGICPYCSHRSESVHSKYLGRYKTCPFSVSVLSFILKYASSSATIRTVAGRLLPSSLATKCSAIGGAPADARGWWPVRDYWCLQVLPAGCLDTWAYTSVPLPSCVISTGCIPLHTKMSER